MEFFESLDLFDELVEHAGFGEELDALEGEGVILVGDNVFFCLEVEDVQFQDGTDVGVVFDKAHGFKI